MSAIEVTEAYPKCRRVMGSGAEGDDRSLSLSEINRYLFAGFDIRIYVDGWNDPWKCFLDASGELRAQCPTAPKITPLVIQGAREGAVYTGCDCACHGDETDPIPGGRP